MSESLRKSKTANKRGTRVGFSRSFAGKPTSVDVESRSFDAVITTETPVRRWVPNPRVRNPETEDCSWIEVDEVLVAAGIDLSRARGMPLLDCHDSYSGIDKILGKVDDVRIEAQTIVGRPSLAHRHADLLPDIIDGYLGNISAGYDYDIYDDTELQDRPNDVPLLLVNRWLLTETSIVPVGADPNAFIRSAYAANFPPMPPKTRSAIKTQEKRMDIEALVKAAEDAVASAEEAIGAAEDAIPEELVERIRALRAARAEDDTTDDPAVAVDPEEKPAEGERAEGDDDEPTEAEKKEVEAVRSIAKAYGLTKLVDDLSGLRAKPVEIRSAVREAVMKRGLSSTPDAPAAVQPAKRSATPTEQLPSARSIYANLNGRKA
ncbi:hypothetical protein [Shinella sp.]|uniref:hypothetical protein n=1 Tax=Shinella sp. TaxID=1870904 RepID=UPI0039E519FB